MSKYNPLWTFIKSKDHETIKLSYEEIKEILGFSIDHSFLKYKKELLDYGYQVVKISMKEENVIFERTKSN